jgi:hypothetical protein
MRHASPALFSSLLEIDPSGNFRTKSVLTIKYSAFEYRFHRNFEKLTLDGSNPISFIRGNRTSMMDRGGEGGEKSDVDGDGDDDTQYRTMPW